MPLRIGINGFGRIGRLALTAGGTKRSAIVGGLSTMVVDGTWVKVLAWHDNEIGYVHRLIELAAKVGASR